MTRQHSLLITAILLVGLILSLNACGSDSGGGGGGGGSVPAAPTGLTANASDQQVTLSWNASSGATFYNIYWSATSTGSTTTGSLITYITTTSLIHSGRTNGTTYYYVVTAVNGNGESAPSSLVSATPAQVGSAPPAPTGLTANASDQQVILSWNVSSGATYYNIYWSTSSTVNTTTGSLITGSTTTSSVHTGRTNGTTYYYIVTAVNTTGESPASSVVSATPGTPVMTVELYNTIPGTTNAGVNTKIYRVTAKDAAGFPMNGLKVNLYGTFSAGSNINMAGSIGSVPLGGVVNLNSSIELNGSGIQDFFLTAPTTTAIPVPTPAISGLTSSPGSGGLSDGSYGFAVTALDAATPLRGETVQSSVSRIALSTGGTVTNNAIQVNWNPVNGAAGYNVYGCIGVGCAPVTRLVTLSTVTQYIVSNLGAGGTATQGFGTTGIAINTVSGTIDVQSGSLSQLLSVSLP